MQPTEHSGKDILANEIRSYRVGVCRTKGKGPVRWLILELAQPVEGLSKVSLFFYESEPPELGFRNPQTGFLIANIMVSDFEPMYHILQTEKPAFVNWTVDPDNVLTSIDVCTSREPLGEGFLDRS